MSSSATPLEISSKRGKRDWTREDTSLTTFFSKSLITAWISPYFYKSNLYFELLYLVQILCKICFVINAFFCVELIAKITWKLIVSTFINLIIKYSNVWGLIPISSPSSIMIENTYPTMNEWLRNKNTPWNKLISPELKMKSGWLCDDGKKRNQFLFCINRTFIQIRNHMLKHRSGLV